MQNQENQKETELLEIFDCEQRSDEWYALRCGCVTATGLENVLNKKTGRGTYMMKLLGERMTGVCVSGYTNASMEYGIETESFAREAYEEIHDVRVKEVGFVKSQKWVGCSPDGFIGKDGELEIKCPDASTHCGYILKGVFPTKYKLQVQSQMWITGRKWCDFVSYRPDMKQQKLWVIRVEADLELHKELTVETEKFLKELAEKEDKIRNPF